MRTGSRPITLTVHVCDRMADVSRSTIPGGFARLLILAGFPLPSADMRRYFASPLNHTSTVAVA